MNYHLMFNEEQVGSGTVEATRALITKIWRGSTKKKLAAINSFVEIVSDAYGINNYPTISFVSGAEGELAYPITGGGSYHRQSNKIVLYKKISLVTLLHEFRHAMQCLMDTDRQVAVEDDAAGWSHSLYYLADPERYLRAKERGLFKH